MSLLSRSYRRLSRRVAAPVLRKIRGDSGTSGSAQARTPEVRRAWLHAASAGELECLWTLALELASSGGELALTVFSPSAANAVSRLSEEVRARGGQVLIQGFSPVEGDWLEALARFRPEVFITAKYEAWPELWMSLSELRIPLTIVGAQDRASLRWARRVCRWLGAVLPEMTLLLADPDPKPRLQSLFPEARIEVTGDPRWDRVRARAKAGNIRARALTELCSALPRPWGILGSAWDQDLELFVDPSLPLPGTLWVVPHLVDSGTVRAMTARLAGAGKRQVALSSRLTEAPHGESWAVLVDEMGFLSELYAHADWAFVGGGFGSGVHSTIEPAIHAIPVACGPAGAGRFPEIQELRETGQCTVIATREELRQWLQVALRPDPRRRERWGGDVARRLGGTARVLSLLPVDSRT
jgi:3-deoxy-D-manno-octulosonic-acid transferase